MIKISTKEFVHNFAKYKKKAKAGEKVVVCERNIPVLDVTSHQENLSKSSKPGWMRDHYRLPAGGESLTETVIKERRESKY